MWECKLRYRFCFYKQDIWCIETETVLVALNCDVLVWEALTFWWHIFWLPAVWCHSAVLFDFKWRFSEDFSQSHSWWCVHLSCSRTLNVRFCLHIHQSFTWTAELLPTGPAAPPRAPVSSSSTFWVNPLFLKLRPRCPNLLLFLCVSVPPTEDTGWAVRKPNKERGNKVV